MNGAFAMPNEQSQSARFRDDSAATPERTYSTMNHLAGLLSLMSAGVPLPGLLGTIIMWRIKHNDSPFLDDHGREAVNFQISLVIYALGAVALGTTISVVTFGLAAPLVVIAAPLAYVAYVALNLVGCIRGAIAANKGEYYRYPMSIRLIAGKDE